MVPVNKQTHLRPLATINQVNKCISILKSKPKIKRSMWSRRAQEYEAKISSGKIYELAEVVKDLNKNTDILNQILKIQNNISQKINNQSVQGFKKINLSKNLKIYEDEINKLKKIDVINKKNMLEFILKVKSIKNG